MLNYEGFICSAFGLATLGRGELIDKWTDPASLANQDYMNLSNELSSVKSATSYAMCIYRNYLKNNIQDVEEADYTYIEDALFLVLDARKVTAIDAEIEIFRVNIIEKYKLNKKDI